MEKINSREILVGCLCALGCETLFGLSYIFTKQATNHASSFALLGWRFFVAILVMTALIKLKVIKIDLKNKSIKPLVIVAILNPVIYFVGETVGISQTTASESGAFLACIPVFSLVASNYILGHKPSKIQLIGILTTLVGVLTTVFAVGLNASFSISGYIMLTFAVISYALYTVFVEKAGEYNGAEITYIMLLFGAVIYMVLAFAEAFMSNSVSNLLRLPINNIDFLVAILYQGIGCSVLAFFLSNVAISKIGVNKTASFIGIATVVSIIAGVILLGEEFNKIQVIGAIMILLGVYVANMKFKASK